MGWVEVEVTGKDGILLRGLSDILLGAGSIRANITLFLNPWTLSRKLPSENRIKNASTKTMTKNIIVRLKFENR